MKCPECGMLNPKDRQRCYCGHVFTPIKCPECGKENAEDSVRCECGHAFRAEHVVAAEKAEPAASHYSAKEAGFFAFEKLVTRSVVPILYIMGSVLILIAGILGLIDILRLGPPRPPGFWRLILLHILGYAVGLIFWRVLCEVLIIIFRIHDGLKEIRERLSSPAEDEEIS